MEKNFFAVLISTLGRFDRANKKKSVIYTLTSKLIAIDHIPGFYFEIFGTKFIPRFDVKAVIKQNVAQSR